MQMDNELNILSSRAGFNAALRHFKTVTQYASEVDRGENLADLINEDLESGTLFRFQVKSIVNALLAEKFSYAFRSYNLEQTIEDAQKVFGEIYKWTNIQFIVAYSNPQTGLSIFNPKRAVVWDSIYPLVKDELLVVYAGYVFEEVDGKVLRNAADDFLKLLSGGSVKPKEGYIAKGRVAEPPAPEPVREEPSMEEAAAAPKRRMTPRYSVLVTNELFHNGNVEAWKKIIQSYKTKYPGLDVLIWYENERINDINALFKWGKVKHGTPILISVTGENIKDVSKLQRYLFEGASPRFETFLRGEFDRVLDLF